ncbi:MAG: hypothetical protein ACE5KE_12850 [Methanosarcinales archaeon]
MPGYPDRNGTVAYWTFDEGSGNIAHDISGNGNDGSVYGASWTSGKVGKALDFDGSNDYVDTHQASNCPFHGPNSNYTIE